MSSYHGQGSSPYVAGPSSRGDLPLPRVIARVLLVVVPAQIVGLVLEAFVVPFDALVAHPALGYLTYVFVGVVAGLALGLVLRPGRSDLVRYAAAAAVAGIVVLTIILAAAHAGLTASGSRSLLSDLVPGVPIAVVLQTVLAVLLWRRRHGSAA